MKRRKINEKEMKNYKIYGVDYFIGSNVKFNDYQAMFCW